MPPPEWGGGPGDPMGVSGGLGLRGDRREPGGEVMAPKPFDPPQTCLSFPIFSPLWFLQPPPCPKGSLNRGHLRAGAGGGDTGVCPSPNLHTKIGITAPALAPRRRRKRLRGGKSALRQSAGMGGTGGGQNKGDGAASDPPPPTQTSSGSTRATFNHPPPKKKHKIPSK